MKFQWIIFVPNKTFIAGCNEVDLKREGLFWEEKKAITVMAETLIVRAELTIM